MSLPPSQNNCAPVQGCCDTSSPACVAAGGVPYKGDPGDTGVAGSNGVNAYTVLSSGFVVPIAGSNVTTGVANTLWMVVGEILFIQFAGYYEVISVLSSISVTLKNLGYSTNAIAGTSIPVAAKVTPSGPIGPAGSTTGVTSVAMSVPAPLAVAGSPVTGSGGFTVTWNTGQLQNLFLATPNGSSGAVGLRAIVAADLPSSVTVQGNSFNGVGNLVQLNGAGALPALSGANLTNLNASNLATGTVPDARLSAQVVLTTGIPTSIRRTPTIQASSPLTGATVTFGTQVTDIDLFLTPAGTLATLSIDFPVDANTYVTQELWVHSTQAVTTLAVSVAGGTIYGTAAVTLAAGGVLGYRKLAANVWFRIV